MKLVPDADVRKCFIEVEDLTDACQYSSLYIKGWILSVCHVASAVLSPSGIHIECQLCYLLCHASTSLCATDSLHHDAEVKTSYMQVRNNLHVDVRIPCSALRGFTFFRAMFVHIYLRKSSNETTGSLLVLCRICVDPLLVLGTFLFLLVGI